MTHDSNLLEYSDAATAQVGTMTVKGVVNVYPAPAGQFPGQLARKPDGTIVYIDVSSSNIGTFLPSTVPTVRNFIRRAEASPISPTVPTGTCGSTPTPARLAHTSTSS